MDIAIVQTIFSVIILIMSVVIHEVSHGYTAYVLGDPTAAYEGRLTLNPIKHIDPLGSIIVPLITYFSAGLAFGWAKPVPYNPYNLKNQRWGDALVAAAGPASNLIIAIFFGVIVRFFGASLPHSFVDISVIVVIVNLALTIFNLIPIPPLDGSKILFSFIPFRFQRWRRMLEQYSMLMVILFVLFFSQYLGVVVAFIFSLITGIKLQ